MAKKKLTITLEPINGGLTLFYAFVDSKRVIQGDATKKRLWSGDIESGTQVKIKVRVVGIGKAKYKLSIDLPGTSEDQSMDLTLNNGYHEIEVTI